MITCPKCKRTFKSAKSMGGHARHCSVTVEDLFWPKVDQNSKGGCWIWMSYRNNNGYGLMTVPKHKQLILAHRWTYERFVGPIPKGMFVLHKCDVRECVNPEHLYVGSFRENTIDFYSRNRHRDQVKAEEVRAIREMLKTMTATEVAKKTGRKYSQIYNLMAGNTYAYIK